MDAVKRVRMCNGGPRTELLSLAICDKEATVHCESATHQWYACADPNHHDDAVVVTPIEEWWKRVDAEIERKRRKSMDLDQLYALYTDADPGKLVLSAGNTGRIELADSYDDDEDRDFAEYEFRDCAEVAVELHNAFPELVANVRRLAKVVERLLKESRSPFVDSPIAAELREVIAFARESKADPKFEGV
jgi:hypothetical protein